MCGKTLIKSLSAQFYLGDITRVQCCRWLRRLWDRGRTLVLLTGNGAERPGRAGGRGPRGREPLCGALTPNEQLESASRGSGAGGAGALGWGEVKPAGVSTISAGVPPSLPGDAGRGRWECVCPKVAPKPCRQSRQAR